MFFARSEQTLDRLVRTVLQREIDHVSKHHALRPVAASLVVNLRPVWSLRLRRCRRHRLRSPSQLWGRAGAKRLAESGPVDCVRCDRLRLVVASDSGPRYPSRTSPGYLRGRRHRVVGQRGGRHQGEQDCEQPETLQHQQSLVRARSVVGDPAGVLTGDQTLQGESDLFTAAGQCRICTGLSPLPLLADPQKNRTTECRRCLSGRPGFRGSRHLFLH